MEVTFGILLRNWERPYLKIGGNQSICSIFQNSWGTTLLPAFIFMLKLGPNFQKKSFVSQISGSKIWVPLLFVILNIESKCTRFQGYYYFCLTGITCHLKTNLSVQILISSWCEDCRRWFCWVHSTLEAYIRKPFPTKDMTLCALKVYRVLHIIFLFFQRTQWKTVDVVAPQGWKIIRVFIFTFIGWSSSRWEWQKFVLADNIYGFTEMAFVLEYSGILAKKCVGAVVTETHNCKSIKRSHLPVLSFRFDK